jgi:hypothetical protein
VLIIRTKAVLTKLGEAVRSHPICRTCSSPNRLDKLNKRVGWLHSFKSRIDSSQFKITRKMFKIRPNYFCWNALLQMPRIQERTRSRQACSLSFNRLIFQFETTLIIVKLRVNNFSYSAVRTYVHTFIQYMYVLNFKRFTVFKHQIRLNFFVNVFWPWNFLDWCAVFLHNHCN